MENISWSIVEEKKYSKLYSASFGHSKSHQGKYILAGGSGAYNDVKLFNIGLKKVGQIFFIDCSLSLLISVFDLVVCWNDSRI